MAPEDDHDLPVCEQGGVGTVASADYLLAAEASKIVDHAKVDRVEALPAVVGPDHGGTAAEPRGHGALCLLLENVLDLDEVAGQGAVGIDELPDDVDIGVRKGMGVDDEETPVGQGRDVGIELAVARQIENIGVPVDLNLRADRCEVVGHLNDTYAR